jgi:hypothetical protein
MISKVIRLIDRSKGYDPHYDGDMAERHSSIMQRLPLGSGLTPNAVIPLLKRQGFADIAVRSQADIARGQRAKADLRNRLRTRVYRKFVISCIKPR